MGIEEKLKHLEEVSLINFSKHTLASPQILQYSQERRVIQGDAPQSTKMVDISIGDDNVTFFYLTEATEKYGDDHEYFDADPKKNFQLERDPSATYEIQLKFLHLRKLTQNKNITLNDVKNWLWSTDLMLWSNSPSFHWQGFNKKLTNLGMAIHPWNGQDTGRWDKIHGDGLIDKHLFDLFLHVKFFINLMAGQLLNRLRTQGYVSKYQRPKKQVPVQSTTPVEPNVEDETGIPETEFDAKVQDNLNTEEPTDNQETINMDTTQPTVAPAPNPSIVANPTKQKKDPNAGLNADITKPQEKSRRNTPGVLMHENIRYSRIPTGYEAKFIINEKEFKLTVERNPGFLESTISDYNSKTDRFFFESDRAMNWKARFEAVNNIKSFTEVGVFLSGSHLDTLLERNQVKVNFNKILTNIIEHDDFDIASLVLESGDDGFATLILEIAKDWDEVGFKTFNMVDSTNLTPRSFIFKEDSIYNSIFKKTLKEQENGKTLVMAYGSFSPPTSDHIAFLRTMIATGEKANADVLLFLQPSDEFETSSATLNQEQAILRSIDGLADLNVCLEEGIRDIYDALMFAYSKLKYDSIILMCGSDQELAYQTMVQERNGQRTENGFFKFNSIKVISTGRPNPDKSQQAIDARNAILNGDFKSFIKGANLPYVSSFKNLFDLLRYGAEEKIGV